MNKTSLPVDPTNAEAAEAWNGYDGDHWVRWAELYDQSVRDYHRPFLDGARIQGTDRVLDIGCGNGQTTRDAAALAADGDAVGVDLSEQLVENARRIAAAQGVGNATFLHADAQVYPFDPARFNVAISRTGAMFFGDPVAAFSNIGRALRPDLGLPRRLDGGTSAATTGRRRARTVLLGRTRPRARGARRRRILRHRT
jgi:SAM-dependent methyltransferase